MSHIFISYSKKDAAYALKLAASLRTHGFDVWLDNHRLRSSDDWWRSIVLALDECVAFVVILSPAADTSRWVQREITIADQRGKPIFPLLLSGDIDTPNWSIFVRTQYEDVRSRQLPRESFYAKLAEFAPRHASQPGTDQTGLIDRPNISSDLQATISNPPHHEGIARWRWLALLGTIIVVVIAIIGLNLPRGDLSVDELFHAGEQAAYDGNFEQAVDYFTRALEGGYEPRALILTERGDVYRFTDNDNLARADYETALTADPAQFKAHIGLGHLATGEERIKHYRNAYEYAVGAYDKSDALHDLGRALHDLRNYDEAIAVFEQVFDLNLSPPELNWTYYELGMVYLDRDEPGDLERALENLEKATSVDPEPEFDHVLKYAQVLENNGETAAALETYRELVRLVEQEGAHPPDWVPQKIVELETLLGD